MNLALYYSISDSEEFNYKNIQIFYIDIKINYSKEINQIKI